MAALKKCADPLKPHARIDGLHVQCLHRAIFKLFILHEHDVPYLNEPIAVLFW